MSEPIVPITAIHACADTAAREYAQGGDLPNCPYPFASDAAAEWNRIFQVRLLGCSAERQTA